MSDFLIYAARMQDAGVERLRVDLFTAPDRTRMMRVTLANFSTDRYPPRDFELDGTDRVLTRLKDDITYTDGGVTAEKVNAAIKAHPLLADDLREWLVDWLLMNCTPEEDPAADDAAAAAVDDAMVERTGQYIRGLMRGIDLMRARKARSTGSAA